MKKIFMWKLLLKAILPILVLITASSLSSFPATKLPIAFAQPSEIRPDDPGYYVPLPTPTPSPVLTTKEKDDCGCNEGKTSFLDKLKRRVMITYNPAGAVKEGVERAICQAVCSVSKALGGLVAFFIKQLLDVAGVSIDPSLYNRLVTTCWFKSLI
jgi:hypothetical protein